MLTILEAIQLSTDYLSKKGVESARTNAELLLADILKCDRLKLYLTFDKPLSDFETAKYRESIQRRGKFEPLQYITGKVEFYGLEFNIVPKVLIPRPETEFLIETMINKFDKNTPFNILDIGCGSGIIPVTLAKHFPNSKITSVDINEEALECAKKNALKFSLEQNITFQLLDILSPDAEVKLSSYDMIVSNPPYVSEDEFITLQEEIVKYEPANAVTDFKDGFTFYKRICSLSKDKLVNGGWLFLEMGKGQSGEISQLFNENNFCNIELVKDIQKIDRVIYGMKK